MKKLRTMAALLLSGLLLVSINSCKPEDDDPITRAFWDGVSHNFENMQVYLDKTGGFTQATGNLAGGGTFDLFFDATSTGTYTLGNNANIYMNYNNKYYFGNLTGATGTVNVTKIDEKNKWIELNFNGTVVNNANNADKLDITEGIIRTKFQF